MKTLGIHFPPTLPTNRAPFAHAARTNISCQACPLAVAPYFTHVHDNLVHLSTAHHNALATTLVNLFPDGDNAPAVLEVISQSFN